jgi:hypothetical protein
MRSVTVILFSLEVRSQESEARIFAVGAFAMMVIVPDDGASGRRHVKLRSGDVTIGAVRDTDAVRVR